MLRSVRSGSTFTNPVAPRNRPDPSLLFDESSGHCFAFSTRNYGAKRINVPVERSSDFRRFTFVGDALPVLPSWAKPGTRDVWAPQAIAGDGTFGARGTFYLFYCVPYDPQGELGPEEGFAISVATSKRAHGPYVDHGRPLIFAPGYRVLDPMVFFDPESRRPHLLWGSHHQPIQIRELAPSLLEFAKESSPNPILDVADRKFERLREGAFLRYREDSRWKYQLYVSGDNVWKEDEYGITVHVAERLEGPYFGISEIDPRRESNVIMQGGLRYERTGHNSIFTDARGDDYLVQHVVDREQSIDPTSGELLRKMWIERVYYDELGLPYTKNGRPSEEPQPIPTLPRVRRAGIGRQM